MGQFNQLLDQWRKERQDAWEKEFHDNRTENEKRYDSPREIEEKLKEFLHKMRERTIDLWEWSRRLPPEDLAVKTLKTVTTFLWDVKTCEAISERLEWPPSGLPTVWESANHLFDECLRALARLTGQPDGALVPLWDVIDEQKYDRYLVMRELFAWATREAPAPVPYDANAAIFTKVSETFTAIQQLLKSFDDWVRDEGGKKS